MYIYKTLFVFLLFTIDTTLAFSYMPNNINRINNNISLSHKRGTVQQSSCMPLAHIIASASAASPTSSPTSSLASLSASREPQNTIGDDVNIMKLLYLKLDNMANQTDNNTVNMKTKAKINVVVHSIMKNCKKNGINIPEASVSNLQKYCSPTNIIKNKNTRALVFCFKRCKYSLLLDNFSNYEIIGHTKNIDASGNPYYCVDIKVSAPYKIMLRNRIQFNDMYYPKIRDNNNICYVIYKLSLKEYEDGNLYIDGHTLVPPRTQI